MGSSACGSWTGPTFLLAWVPGRNMLNFPRCASWLHCYWTLRSNWAQRRPSQVASWQRTHTRLTRPGGPDRWDPVHSSSKKRRWSLGRRHNWLLFPTRPTSWPMTLGQPTGGRTASQCQEYRSAEQWYWSDQQWSTTAIAHHACIEFSPK